MIDIINNFIIMFIILLKPMLTVLGQLPLEYGGGGGGVGGFLKNKYFCGENG